MSKRGKRLKRKRLTSTSRKSPVRRRLNKRGYSKEYLQLRNEVMARDHWTCQLCNTAGIKLQVHHITLYSKSRKLRSNKYNLISLCKECHNSIRNKESRYKAKLRLKVLRNTKRYRLHKKTQEEVIEELKQKCKLPADFTEYKYKTEDDVKKTKAKEYYLRKTWRDIKHRTSNPKSKSYKRYGGRGIKMYRPWFDDFAKFKSWILENLGERPEGMSIDRIDNDGNYAPGNLRWAGADVQRQNNSQTTIDESLVLVIWILYHKYKWRQIDIVHKFKLATISIVSGITRFRTWKNVTYKYHSLVSDDSVRERMLEYNADNM